MEEALISGQGPAENEMGKSHWKISTRVWLFVLSYCVSIRKFYRKNLTWRDISGKQEEKERHFSPSEYFHYKADTLLERERYQLNQAGNSTQFKRARTKLKSLVRTRPLKCEVIEKENALKRDDFLIERVFLRFGPRQDCPIDIITHESSKCSAKPLMICMQGYNSGAHLSLGKIIEPVDVYKVASGSSIALDAARLGFRVISYERPCFGERREQKLHKPIPNPSVDAVFSALMVGETLMGQTVSEVSSLIDWADEEFDCSKRGVYLAGYSAGGTTALFASALDERIDGIAVGGCIGKFKETVMRRGTNGFVAIPDLLNYFELDTIMGLIAPRILVAISGITDHIFPYKGAEECFALARQAFRLQNAESAIVHIRGERGHTYYPEKLWPAFVGVINHRSKVTGKFVGGEKVIASQIY